MSGSVLAATAFAPHWILQLPAILATAPIFWLLRNVSVKYTYVVGVCFTLAWLIPTTYWYYNIFTMIMLVDLSKITCDFTELKDDLEALGKTIGQSIRIQHEDIFNAMHQI